MIIIHIKNKIDFLYFIIFCLQSTKQDIKTVLYTTIKYNFIFVSCSVLFPLLLLSFSFLFIDNNQTLS
jgi:hypothetical protein